MVPIALYAPQAAEIATQADPPPTTDSARRGQPHSVRESVRNAISQRAFPGLIRIPNAAELPDGMFDAGFSAMPDREAFPTAESQSSLNVALTVFPRLTIWGRGTVPVDDDKRLNPTRDLVAGAQLLLLREGSWWPGLAIGGSDFGGAAPHYRSYYAVASKTLFSSVRITAGLGHGPEENKSILEGPFGGVEYAVNPFLTMMGEYDGKAVTPAVRVFPLPPTWEQRGLPRPVVDMALNQGRDFSWGVSVRGSLGGLRKDDAPEETIAVRRRPRHERREQDGTTSYALAREVQAALMDQGLESVRVALDRTSRGLRITIEYENRRFNRDELDAVGVVLGVASKLTPESVHEIRVVVKEVNLPVLAVSVDAETLVSYLDESISDAEFASELHFVQDGSWLSTPSDGEATTGLGDPSWAKLDLFLKPRVQNYVLTDLGTYLGRFSALPSATTQLLPGTAVDVQAEVPIVKADLYDAVNGSAPTTAAVERVIVHQAAPIPIGRLIPTTAAMTQVSVGRFFRDSVGVQHETAMTVLNGYGLLKGTWACIGPTFAQLSSPRQCMVLANARVRYPALNTTLSFTAGRFLDQDKGVAFDLSRFFGATEIGMFLRHTDNGAHAGIRIALPLTFSKELKPWRVRPRLPDLYSYELKSVVFEDANPIRGVIGRKIETNHALEDVYWNRDRLYPAYIRQHVDTLREAVHSWVDDDAAGAAGKTGF